jgi:predicted component of type VI protein secretion system
MVLFEKLGGLPVAGGEVEAMRRSLEQLFNTREHYGAFVEGYGLRELGLFTTDITLAEHIRELIARWEPRLGSALVKAIGRDSERRLHFRVTGRMNDEECVLRVTLNPNLFEAKVTLDQ